MTAATDTRNLVQAKQTGSDAMAIAVALISIFILSLGVIGLFRPKAMLTLAGLQLSAVRSDR